MPSFAIEPMEPQDWAAVSRIYQQGLDTGLAAFLTRPPLWRDWNAGHFPFGRIVGREGAEVLGWAALSRVGET